MKPVTSLPARLAHSARRLGRAWSERARIEPISTLDARLRQDLGLPPLARPADRFYL